MTDQEILAAAKEISELCNQPPPDDVLEAMEAMTGIHITKIGAKLMAACPKIAEMLIRVHGELQNSNQRNLPVNEQAYDKRLEDQNGSN